MNRLMTIGIAALLLAGCAGQNPLVGTWEMIESGDSAVVGPRLVKVLDETHFAFGRQTGDGIWAGGGEYSLQDGVYLETVNYHSLPKLVGLTLRFDCRLEGDLWYHEGRFDARGEAFHIREVWRRVD